MVAHLTESEVQQILTDTIKDNPLYSVDDFIDFTPVRAMYSEEVEEFGLIYSPRRISEKKINTYEEHEEETDLDEPRISYISIGVYLQNKKPFSEEDFKSYDEFVKPLREAGLSMHAPRPRLRGDIDGLIGIAPPYRKQGNGRKLIELVEDLARNVGLADIREILPIIQDEKRFLQHLGYYIPPEGSAYYASKKLIWNQN